jgi:hypothetical protein
MIHGRRSILPSLPSLPREEQLPTMASEEAIIDDVSVAHSFTTVLVCVVPALVSASPRPRESSS